MYQLVLLVIAMLLSQLRGISGIASTRNLGRSSIGLRQCSRRWCMTGATASGEYHKNPKGWTIRCSTAEDIEALGEKISPHLGAGDVLLLRGDLGAGKTCFARGLIREKHQDTEMIVTSPSYLLDNTYDLEEGAKIHHMDLYRLPEGCDMTVLGIPQIFEDSLCLIEWPQRMSADIYPQDYLDVELRILEDESREIRFTASSQNAARWSEKLSGLF